MFHVLDNSKQQNNYFRSYNVTMSHSQNYNFWRVHLNMMKRKLQLTKERCTELVKAAEQRFGFLIKKTTKSKLKLDLSRRV